MRSLRRWIQGGENYRRTSCIVQSNTFIQTHYQNRQRILIKSNKEVHISMITHNLHSSEEKRRCNLHSSEEKRGDVISESIPGFTQVLSVQWHILSEHVRYIRLQEWTVWDTHLPTHRCRQQDLELTLLFNPLVTAHDIGAFWWARHCNSRHFQH